jgi:hypothetical protein
MSAELIEGEMNDAIIVILHGSGHVVAYQNHAAILFLGLIMGVPIREALCSAKRVFRPLFGLMDDVFATGVPMRVDVAGGTIWLVRLSDESGVGLYFDRRLAQQPVAPREEPTPIPLALAG